MDYDRNDALLHWLFKQTQGDAWFRPNEAHITGGVALRVGDGESRSLCVPLGITLPRIVLQTDRWQFRRPRFAPPLFYFLV